MCSQEARTEQDARGARRFRQNTLSHNAHGNVVLLEQASSELVGNIVSHGPLGGIIIRGATTVRMARAL
jgi:hypothetical protein